MKQGNAFMVLQQSQKVLPSRSDGLVDAACGGKFVLTPRDNAGMETVDGCASYDPEKLWLGKRRSGVKRFRWFPHTNNDFDSQSVKHYTKSYSIMEANSAMPVRWSLFNLYIF